MHVCVFVHVCACVVVYVYEAREEDCSKEFIYLGRVDLVIL